VEEKFSLTPLDLQKLQTLKELREANELTVKFGLSLSEKEILELTEQRFAALKDTGRIEFGRGIIKQLAEVFCDSPYLTRESYMETLLELQESFYYFKNESMDRIPDDELIQLMKKYFDGVCKGSLDYLSGTSLEELCRRTRYGRRPDEEDEEDDDDGELF
jgi:hypothetical protein